MPYVLLVCMCCSRVFFLFFEGAGRDGAVATCQDASQLDDDAADDGIDDADEGPIASELAINEVSLFSGRFVTLLLDGFAQDEPQERVCML